jgi:FMN-dependent NADH-azoreductase
MDLTSFYRAEPDEAAGKSLRRLLQIDCSPRMHYSYTRMLSGEFVSAWREAHPETTVERRDLATQPPPYISGAVAHLLHTGSPPGGYLSPQDHEAIEIANAIAEQFIAADAYVMGVPMYYAHVPANFKAYMDHLAYFGRTVTLTSQGPQGLLTDKKAVVITARGFDYGPGSPIESYDLQEPWLRGAFAFIGITDVTFINLNGLDFGEEAVRGALSEARKSIQQVVNDWCWSG